MSDWVCGRCKSINRERAATCYSCGGMRGAVQLQPNTLAPNTSSILGGGTPDAAAATPAAAAVGVGVGDGAAAMTGDLVFADVTMPEPKPAVPAGPEHLLGGFIGGAIGAAVATGLWTGVVAVTNWQIGLVAIAVGFIVGQATVFGAGGRASILLVPISLGLTLVGLVASEYLIQYTFAVQVLGPDVIDVIQPPGFVLEVVVDSLTADPLTLIFWGFAAYEAVVIPMRAASRGG